MPFEDALTQRDWNGKHEAFGLRKTLMEWSQDERCVVDHFTLRARLKSGRSLEEAMAEKPQPRTGPIAAFGEVKGAETWARDSRAKVCGETIRRRISEGMDAETAITLPPEVDVLMVKAFGETKTASAWSTDPRCAVSNVTLLKRLRQGIQPEQAITEAGRSRWRRQKHRFWITDENGFLTLWDRNDRDQAGKAIRSSKHHKHEW